MLSVIARSGVQMETGDEVVKFSLNEIVQFRIHQDRWIKRQKTHLYRVSLNMKQNIHKC